MAPSESKPVNWLVPVGAILAAAAVAPASAGMLHLVWWHWGGPVEGGVLQVDLMDYRPIESKPSLYLRSMDCVDAPEHWRHDCFDIGPIHQVGGSLVTLSSGDVMLRLHVMDTVERPAAVDEIVVLHVRVPAGFHARTGIYVGEQGVDFHAGTVEPMRSGAGPEREPWAAMIQVLSFYGFLALTVAGRKGEARAAAIVSLVASIPWVPTLYGGPGILVPAAIAGVYALQFVSRSHKVS
jgi:hypothetical protein